MTEEWCWCNEWRTSSASGQIRYVPSLSRRKQPVPSIQNCGVSFLPVYRFSIPWWHHAEWRCRLTPSTLLAANPKSSVLKGNHNSTVFTSINVWVDLGSSESRRARCPLQWHLAQKRSATTRASSFDLHALTFGLLNQFWSRHRTLLCGVQHVHYGQCIISIYFPLAQAFHHPYKNRPCVGDMIPPFFLQLHLREPLPSLSLLPFSALCHSGHGMGRMVYVVVAPLPILKIQPNNFLVGHRILIGRSFNNSWWSRTHSMAGALLDDIIMLLQIIWSGSLLLSLDLRMIDTMPWKKN